MIIVSGANGTLGRQIVERLLIRGVSEEIGVSVRDAAKAAALRKRGVRVRRGDYTDPDSLRSAFEGGRVILLVSSNTRAGDTVQQHRAAIDAAVAAGAERLVYTSHAGVNPESSFIPARNHAATETMLAESGVPYTALRNGFYAVTPTYYLGSVREDRTIVVPADGPVAWTTQSDLADAAAAILAGVEHFDGPTPPLTAAEALTFDDIARTVSEISGESIRRETVSDEQFVTAAVSEGTPEAAARFSLGIFQAARAGDFASVDPTLARLLGRAPTHLSDVLAGALAQRG